MVEINLPISYVICYGNVTGRQVAQKLRNMPMKRELFKPFLAAPDSPDVMLGVPFKPEIDKEIIGCHVMVVVGTCDIHESVEAMREIRLARSNGKHIITFVQEGCRNSLPSELSGDYWTPIEYPKESPESSFEKLKFGILSTCIDIAYTAIVRRENNEQR